LPVRGRDRSCRAPLFRLACAFFGRFSLSSAPSSFGPSLGPPFCSCEPQTLLRPLLTPRRLSAPGSPQVNGWSFRSRLGALQAAVSDRGLRVCAHARPRLPASLPICVPSVERLPSAPSRRFLAGPTWQFGYGSCHQLPSGTFHPDRPATRWAHARRSLTGSHRPFAKSGPKEGARFRYRKQAATRRVAVRSADNLWMHRSRSGGNGDAVPYRGRNSDGRIRQHGNGAAHQAPLLRLPRITRNSPLNPGVSPLTYGGCAALFL